MIYLFIIYGQFYLFTVATITEAVGFEHIMICIMHHRLHNIQSASQCSDTIFLVGRRSEDDNKYQRGRRSNLKIQE